MTTEFDATPPFRSTAGSDHVLDAPPGAARVERLHACPPGGVGRTEVRSAAPALHRSSGSRPTAGFRRGGDER